MRMFSILISLDPDLVSRMADTHVGFVVDGGNLESRIGSHSPDERQGRALCKTLQTQKRGHLVLGSCFKTTVTITRTEDAGEIYKWRLVTDDQS